MKYHIPKYNEQLTSILPLKYHVPKYNEQLDFRSASNTSHYCLLSLIHVRKKTAAGNKKSQGWNLGIYSLYMILRSAVKVNVKDSFLKEVFGNV